MPHSYFQGFWLVELLASCSGAGLPLPLLQDIVTINTGAWLSNVTLKFFNLAEQCRTREFLIWLKMKTTPIVLIQDTVTSNAEAWLSNTKLRFFSLSEQWHTYEFFIWLKNEGKFKYHPDLKNEDDLKNEEDLKNKNNLKKRRRPQKNRYPPWK